MSIIMYKQRFKPPNGKETPKLNYLHIGYIATRPRAMKNKYGEHALFGRYEPNSICDNKEWQAIANYVKFLSYKKVNIYRSIISFNRKNSDELKLLKQQDWQRYCENHIRILAEKNNIQPQNLGWCAAYHNEGDHPHLHVVFWDNKQKIIKNYTKPEIPNQIRIELIKSTYEQKIQDFYEQKKNTALEIKSITEEIISEFEEYMKNLYYKEFKALQKQFEKYSDKENNIQILQLFNNNEQLTNLTEKLFKIRDMLPEKGRINYKLLPPEVKSEVDTLTNELLTENTYLKNAVKKYIDIQVELKSLYQSDNTKLDEYSNKCEKEIKKQISNRILKSVKSIITKEYSTQKAEYTEKQKQYFAMECMGEILETLAQNTVTQNNILEDKKYFEESSDRAIKEWYLKNKDKGHEY